MIYKGAKENALIRGTKSKENLTGSLLLWQYNEIPNLRKKNKKKKRLQTQQGSRLQFYKPVWNQLLEIDS